MQMPSLSPWYVTQESATILRYLAATRGTPLHWYPGVAGRLHDVRPRAVSHGPPVIVPALRSALQLLQAGFPGVC